MIVVPDYKNFRIEVNAVVADGRWNAEVRVLRRFSEEKARVETVTCYKLMSEHTERAAVVWARRWVDVHASA